MDPKINPPQETPKADAANNPEIDPTTGKLKTPEIDPITGKPKDVTPEVKPLASKVVPEKYDLELPEGALLDPARLEEIAAFAKAQGLSQEGAQALVEREANAVTSYADKQKEELAKVSVAWVEEVKADKEIGGEDYKEKGSLSKKALARFGTEKLVKMLEDSRMGDNPEVVRLFYRIGKAMTEDKMVKPGEVPGGERKSTVEVFYGNKEKEETK